MAISDIPSQVERDVTFHITVARHGETQSNRDKILQGHIDTCLNEHGRKQAKCAGERLSQIHFTHVISSDLKRAYETAQLMVQVLNENDKSIETIKQDHRLRERNFGVLENQSVLVLAEEARKRNVSPRSFTPEGAESPDLVRTRVVDFFEDVCRNSHDQDHILIVAHGGFIWELFRHFFETLDCSLPMGATKGAHKHVSRNTSMSKFIVHIKDNNPPTIACQDLHNAKHLDEMPEKPTES